MLRNVKVAVAATGILLGIASAADAATITFDDLATRDNFFALGIASTYEGFEWGYSFTGGPGDAVIPSDNYLGWASGTTANPAVAPAPIPVSGTSYAWNWSGPQSLWIHFDGTYDVAGAYFATLSSAYPINATTIQMFGYDASQTLVASSGLLGLTDSFQFLAADFTGIEYLELRASANGQWFSIDNIELTSSQVPEPGPMLLFGAGIAGLSVRYCHSKHSKAGRELH